MKPTVAVIMPAYNSAHYISEAIKSVIGQTMPDFELVVVDDGSTDHTADVVRRYLGDRRVRLLSQENAGPSIARNRGIAATNSRFISLIDSDDKYEPEYLAKMTGALEANPEMAFYCCDAMLFGDTETVGLRVYGEKRGYPLTLKTVLSRDFQVHGSTTIRRKWVEKIGGYNPERRSAEDLDLWVRMLCEGARGDYLNKPLIWYRRREGSLSTDTRLLHDSEIALYTDVLSRKPSAEIEAICQSSIARSRHHRAIFLAKSALRSRRYRDFIAASSEARRYGNNWKLAMASALLKPVVLIGAHPPGKAGHD